MEQLRQTNLDLYDEYDAYSNYNLNIIGLTSGDISQDNAYRDALRSSYKLKTGSNTKSGGIQFIRDIENDLIKRPITAIQGAGYVSRSSVKALFDPLNLAAQIKASLVDSPKEQTLEDRIKNLESQVLRLLDESCMAEHRGNCKLALEKAKEASSKEHTLIQLLEQSGHAESHNFELTYSVLFTVAHQYVTNEMYSEALNMYKAITKNKKFSNGTRLKINIGNIYAQLGMYHEALKTYRWVLDRIPNTNIDFRTKILHNIGIVFVKMRKLDEARDNFEYVLQEKSAMNAAFHAIVCNFFQGNVATIKKAFQELLNVPPRVTEIQNKLVFHDDEIDVQTEILKRDELSQLIQQMQTEAEKNIIGAANLISPIIEDNYTAGYNWCLEMIIKSPYFSSLSGDLEINKAIACLRNNKSAETAIDALTSFDKRENRVTSLAYTNLSFIHYFLENLDQAEKEALHGHECDMYSAAANVNVGNCYFTKQLYHKAKEFYNLALENDSSCIEALYNLGLTHKKTGHLDESLTCFNKLQMIVINHPEVLYHIAHIHELLDNKENAIEMYQQLLGITPSDIGVLFKLAQMFTNEQEKQQAFHYYSEIYRYYPSNLTTLEWLGEYFSELRLAERAILYFEKASVVQPEEPKWKLMVGSCQRQTGNYKEALRIYKRVMHQFPNNVDCLTLLIRIGRDLGLKETSDWVERLKRAEKMMEQRNYSANSKKNGSSSQSSSRTNSSNLTSGKQAERQKKLEFEYSDPLGPIVNDRPRTSASKTRSTFHKEDDFCDDDLDDDMLPL